jgi:hypothetical protein
MFTETTLGGVGFGLVWGWLSASLTARERLTIRLIIAVFLATLILAGLLWWASGWRGLAFFLGMGLLSFLLHAGWRHQLRRNLGSSNPE